MLWRFHAFHHSQRELNVFSEFRLHPFDMIVSRLLIVVPLAMVQLPPVSLLFLLVVQKWYLMFLHSNTRIHFRMLGYVVATPLFHRMHHSKEVRHANANFGVYLSVWDWLFGTRQEPHGAAPCITGVVEYPAEQDSAWYAMGAVYVRQLLYPFQNLLAERYSGVSRK